MNFVDLMLKQRQLQNRLDEIADRMGQLESEPETPAWHAELTSLENEMDQIMHEADAIIERLSV
jgi:division protein CdvB (Snf7/Vps24/ESCRT-III family)